MPGIRRTSMSTSSTPPIDSSDMSPTCWAQLVEIITKHYHSHDGFIHSPRHRHNGLYGIGLVVHARNLTKPVVLTGSQPMGQLRTDGKENVVTSIELAAAHNADGLPLVPEVCIYFSGRLLRGNRSTKINADGFNASSRTQLSHLCDAGVTFNYHPHNILRPDFDRPMVPHQEMDNVIVLLFPGIEEISCAMYLKLPELHAIVLRSFGNGNAPQKPWIARLLNDAARRDVVIVNISQCVSGTVAMERYDAVSSERCRVVSGRDSTVEAAITKLMYLQARYHDPRIIREK